MKIEERIINEIVSNKELSQSALLMSWIQESDENRAAYIEYKNKYALMQTGAEMTENEVLEELKAFKKATAKPRISIFKNPYFRIAAAFALIVLGSYFYQLTNSDSKPDISMKTISAPEGKRVSIILPDGSEAILINCSKIIYPSEFVGNTREIYLDGEAFLTVAHNKKMPFKVHCGDHKIEVLGTEFFVTAYAKDDLLIVDLVSGKVKLDVAKSSIFNKYDSYILEPFESLELNKTTGKVRQQKIQDDFYKFWKDGEYVFKRETFKDLALKLERIYHLPIVFEDRTIGSCEFTGTLRVSGELSSILDVFKIASSIPFDYKIEKNQVLIKHIK